MKDLPSYEKCIAKYEIRNVVFKYQMSAMNKQQNQQAILQTPLQAERVQQTAQYGFMQHNQSQCNRFSNATPMSPMSSPPATPRSWGESVMEQEYFH